MAAWIAQWEFIVDVAWYAAMLDDIEGGSDDHRWDTIGFEMTCNQTHGLVTDWSKRAEDCCVGSVSNNAFENVGCINLYCLALAIFSRDPDEV